MRTPDNDEIAQVLAKIAFIPENKKLTDFQRFAVQLFVEEVVLPKESDGYTERDMYNYIMEFLSNKR